MMPLRTARANLSQSPTSKRAHFELPRAFKQLIDPRLSLRYKLFHGGRGGAKSRSFGAALVALGDRAPIRWLFAREIQNSIKASVKKLLDDEIARQELDGYRSTQYGITHKNGSEFFFAGLRTNPDSVKSMEGLDGTWIEEANRTSQSSWDLLTPTIRKPGSEIWLSLNRHKTTDPLDKLFLSPGMKPPPRSLIRKVGWQDNPWFPDVLEEQRLYDMERDIDKYLHIWEGEPVKRSEALVFNRWRVDDIDDSLTADWVPYFGADWGFAKDPTVLIKVFINRKLREIYIREEAFALGCDIDKTPDLFDTIPLSRMYTIRADSARPETISYMQRNGFPKMRPAKKGAGSVEDGVEFLKSYDIVVHPDCENAVFEMGSYSYKVDKLTEDILPELEDDKNHVIDSIRYALEEHIRLEKHGELDAGYSGDDMLGGLLIQSEAQY
jgi:phage terminase large subunit